MEILSVALKLKEQKKFRALKRLQKRRKVMLALSVSDPVNWHGITACSINVLPHVCHRQVCVVYIKVGECFITLI